MGRVSSVIAREFREALPAIIFFLVLFHLLALTKAVALGDFSLTALRATTATIGALVVAKAILLVEALPPVKRLTGSRLSKVLRKTALFAVVVLLFRLLEELIPLWSKHGSLAAGAHALTSEVSWPFFVVLNTWILGGLFFYTLTTDLLHDAGTDKGKAMHFGPDSDLP
jgi:uncharacterized membrane protein